MMIKQMPSKEGLTPEGRSAQCAPSEAALAAAEFAAWIRLHSVKIAARPREHYEVHPCRGVRGFVLRLPVTKWRLWYPNVTAAVSFAETLSKHYQADCRVFDTDGQSTSA